MKLGKVKQAIVVRSILKNLKRTRKEIMEKPSIGMDAARIHFKYTGTAVTAIAFAAGDEVITIDIAIHRAINNVLVKGGMPVGISVALVFPEYTQEAKLKKVMERVNSICKQLGIDVLGGHTTVSKAAKEMLITVNAIGEARKTNEEVKFDKKEMVGAKIIMTKWVGMEATILIANQKQEELSRKYAKSFIEGGKRLIEELSLQKEVEVINEMEQAGEFSRLFMHDVAEGGIFGALWEVGEYLHLGIEADLKGILLKQETIEVCDFFDLNPYMLQSGGCMLIVTKSSEVVMERLQAAGIRASVIGSITSSNDRIVQNEDEIRYLEPSRLDEIYKVL